MHNSYLTFCLQGAWYAVQAKRVREILRLPALILVTEAPHYIIGVVNYRGHILPVMDLGIRLGQPPQSYQIHDHVIVLEQETRLLGMIVNEVHGVQDIPTEMIEVASEYAGGRDTATRLVTHLARYDEKTIMLLDDALLLGLSVERERSVRQLASSLPIHRWASSTGLRHTSGGIAAGQFARTHVLSPDATPEEHEILYERARNLMSSLEQQESTQRAPLAIIGLSGEYFGVELEKVQEFTDLQRTTPVPCCPEYVVGDMNLRGDILTVVDIRTVLQMSVVAAAPTAKVIVVPMGDALVGVLVDQVFDVLDVSPSDVIAVPLALKSINDTYLKGAIPYHSKMLMILNLPEILSNGGLAVNEEV